MVSRIREERGINRKRTKDTESKEITEYDSIIIIQVINSSTSMGCTPGVTVDSGCCCVTVGTLIVTKAPLCWEMFIWAEAMFVWAGLYGKSLDPLLNFAMTLKLL